MFLGKVEEIRRCLGGLQDRYEGLARAAVHAMGVPGPSSSLLPERLRELPARMKRTVELGSAGVPCWCLLPPTCNLAVICVDWSLG